MLEINQIRLRSRTPGSLNLIVKGHKWTAPLAFPDDENGDVLRRMQESGDDLTKSRRIEYQHIFPTKTGAVSFLSEAADESVTVSIRWYVEVRCWDVQVARDMVPSHADISAMEGCLEQLAIAHGGKADGWGCFEMRGQA